MPVNVLIVEMMRWNGESYDEKLHSIFKDKKIFRGRFFRVI